MVVLTLGPEFAAPLAVGIAAAITSTALGVKVSLARKTYKISYPTMYAVSKYDGSKADNKAEDKPDDAHMFNCVQRGHQNYLEQLPTVLALTFIGSLSGNANLVLINAGALALYILSRYSYAAGYATGDPSKRANGTYGYLGLLTSLGLSLYTVAKIAFPQHVTF